MRDKLLRLLMLTQSDNDHEALLAIRKANELLKARNVSWETILSGGGGGAREEHFSYSRGPSMRPARPDTPKDSWDGNDDDDDPADSDASGDTRYRSPVNPKGAFTGAAFDSVFGSAIDDGFDDLKEMIMRMREANRRQNPKRVEKDKK